MAFEKEKGPTLAEIRSVTGIDMDLAGKIIYGVEWYSAADQIAPNSPVSLADPKNLKSGAGALVKKYEDLALGGKMIESRGNIETFIDPRPARIAIQN